MPWPPKRLWPRLVRPDPDRPETTSRHVANAALLFEHAPVALFAADAGGGILSVNRALERITGYTRSALHGQPVSLLGSTHQASAFGPANWARMPATDAWHGEVWSRRRSGMLFTALLTVERLAERTPEGAAFLAALVDISPQKATEARLDYLAHHDALTGLANRTLFLDRLHHALDLARRDPAKHLAVALLDLDGFKALNDTYGHAEGDALLVEVAVRLRGSVRAADTVCRLGGDEFAILLEDLADRRLALMAVEKVRERLEQPFALPHCVARLSASIGLSLYPADGDTTEVLLRRADAAMYAAKAHGRGATRGG